MDGVDDRLEKPKTLRGQSDTSADHDTIPFHGS
jgi:hypothetical protein